MSKKIVLAYSGGLDTSIILKWLQENYNAEVICYTADIGQKIDKKKIISNAKKFGVKKIIINDLKDIFVKDYVFPMIRGHTIGTRCNMQQVLFVVLHLLLELSLNNYLLHLLHYLHMQD